MAATAMGIAASLLLLCGPHAGSARLSAPAATDVAAGRELLDNGTTVTDLTRFPGIVHMSRLATTYAVAAGPDRVVSALGHRPPWSMEEEPVFPIALQIPEGKIDIEPATYIKGYVSIAGALTVLFTTNSLDQIDTAFVGAHPSPGDLLTLIAYDGFLLGRSATSVEVSVVACDFSAEANQFCFDMVDSGAILSEVFDESAPIFNGSEIVGLYQRDTQGSTHVARSLFEFLPDIAAAELPESEPEPEPEDNGKLKTALIAIGGGIAAVGACMLVDKLVLYSVEKEHASPESQHVASLPAPAKESSHFDA